MRQVLVALVALISLTTAAASDQCYRRVYTKAHLAKHPDQLVTSMLLKLEENEVRDCPHGWWQMRTGQLVERAGLGELRADIPQAFAVPGFGVRPAQRICFAHTRGATFRKRQWGLFGS